jgi:hypothetical protein
MLADYLIFILCIIWWTTTAKKIRRIFELMAELGNIFNNERIVAYTNNVKQRRKGSSKWIAI